MPSENSMRLTDDDFIAMVFYGRSHRGILLAYTQMIPRAQAELSRLGRTRFMKEVERSSVVSFCAEACTLGHTILCPNVMVWTGTYPEMKEFMKKLPVNEYVPEGWKLGDPTWEPYKDWKPGDDEEGDEEHGVGFF